MTEQVTVAMWAVDMAELTGCDETIWVDAQTVLPETAPTGASLTPVFPDAAKRESLELLMRGGMAGYSMYAVPICPGVQAPWERSGLLLTDDPAVARWFAALPGLCRVDAARHEASLRVLHLSHSHGEALALLPEERTVWALGADRASICRAVALGLGSYEGRWNDWLTAPMRVEGTTGILTPDGIPHWMQIGPDGKLWAADPWAMEPPAVGLEHLVVCLPELTGLLQTDWDTTVLCAAMIGVSDGALPMEQWYYSDIVDYVNQWGHTQDIVPRLPRCYVGGMELPQPLESGTAQPQLGALAASAAVLQQRLTRPGSSRLETNLAQRLAQLAGAVAAQK